MSKLTKHLPAILSSIATAGVIGTGVLAYRAGKKAAKAKITDRKWTYYVPPVDTGAATIGCLWAAQILNGRQIAALTYSAKITTTIAERMIRLRSINWIDNAR